jgi:hypothetical protein
MEGVTSREVSAALLMSGMTVRRRRAAIELDRWVVPIGCSSLREGMVPVGRHA